VRRVFIAVDVDEPTRDAIGQISLDLRQRLDASASVSWVRPDRMHLTLHFESHADDVAEERFLAALAEPFAMPPFMLSFFGLGVFPAHGSPRVLWLAIRDGLVELRRLQQMLEERISGGDIVKPQSFKPHLTLARFRDRVSRARFQEIATIPASGGPCRIDRVTLYESRLSAAGPRYLRLAESALTGSGSTS
jgi:RNA 2',3'-cyclic 3'-phosphodiesterase